jgi:GMP synthase (glutamine-hydrolysing)
MDSIAILDFGSQYAQIIARRVREAQVYCELFWDALELAIHPKDASSPADPGLYMKRGVTPKPLADSGELLRYASPDYALGDRLTPLLKGIRSCRDPTPSHPLSLVSPSWMSHGDRITKLPDGFIPAGSGNSPRRDKSERKYFGAVPSGVHTNGESCSGISLILRCQTDLDACFHY